MKTNALFSSDRKYRYVLTRQWDETLPVLVYVLLNPSTADETTNDPTISRCIDIARYNGFGGISVMNLFAYRATEPCDLKKGCDPVGPDNDRFLKEISNDQKIVVAWGNHGSFMDRSQKVLKVLEGKNLWCVAKNASGEPKHPLYVKTATPFIPFR